MEKDKRKIGLFLVLAGILFLIYGIKVGVSSTILEGIVFCIVGGVFVLGKRKKRKNFDDGEMTGGTKIMNTDIKKDFIQVTGILVGTYDIAPDNTESVSAIHYLCVYEFEYEGKKYKYRMHKRDNFDPIPETLQLGFKKDPSKAFRVRENMELTTDKSSALPFYIFMGLLIATPIFLLYQLVRMVQMIVTEKVSVIPVLIFAVLAILITGHALKSRKTDKRLDQRIEDAILNNRVVTAYLVKKTYCATINKNDKSLTIYHRYNRYIGLYECEYKGKKYKIKRRYPSDPPKSLKLYFGKNPKDVFYSTCS